MVERIRRRPVERIARAQYTSKKQVTRVEGSSKSSIEVSSWQDQRQGTMLEHTPVVEFENRIGAQLLLAQIGAGERPFLDPRYEIIELRGRGARGVVCRARDRRLERTVALKLYPRLDDSRLGKEVTREAQALARLDHPNVVRVHDVDAAILVTGGERLPCLYLSMEFVEGRSLRAWRTERARTPGEVLRVLLAAGEGLQAAHDQGLVHRDFKPENIMLDQRGRTRIVDFGLAREPQVEDGAAIAGPSATDGSALSERLTRLGEAPGTLEYMAPEARLGVADARSDQFSFAATAWESLTGQLPFDAHDPGRGRPGEYPRPRGGNALDPRVREVLERGLSAEPLQRHPSMRALLHELRRAAGARRRKLLVGLAAAGTGALAGVVAVARLGEPDVPSPKAAASEAQRMEAVDVAACEAVAGRWYFNGVVDWSQESVYWHGVNGYYELDVEPMSGCAARLELRKTGDTGMRHYAPGRVREGHTAVELVPGPEGVSVGTTFQMSSDAKGRQQYHVELLFRGDELAGDYRWPHLQTGRTRSKGVLRGGRVAPAEDMQPDRRGLPCPSQCRLVCATERAASRCIEEACGEGPAGSIPTCTPTGDFVVPDLVRANLEKDPDAMRRSRVGGPGLQRCTKASDMLAGSWVVEQVSNAHVRRAKLELSAGSAPCELRARLWEDGREAVRLEAVVDGKGAWTLVEPWAARPRWSMIGWDPAYGVSSDGSVLSAHKQ